MDALVLASHLPGEGHYRSRKFAVQGIECRGDYDYWQGVKDHWESDLTLINVEHDIEVWDEHVSQLVSCPQPLCTWAYHGHWASTGRPYDIVAAGLGRRDPVTNPDPEHLTGGEEWASWSAIGLVKITAAARVGELRREPWQRLELAVHDAVTRPWHVHWPPVTHHHW